MEIPGHCCAHEEHGTNDGQPEQTFDDGSDDREHKPGDEQDPDDLQHGLFHSLTVHVAPIVESGDDCNPDRGDCDLQARSTPDLAHPHM